MAENSSAYKMDYCERFKNGLLRKGVKMEDLPNWKYAGGDTGRHLKYAILCNIRPLPHYENCICTHKIYKNCYISNGPRVLVLGSCCIKRFIPVKNRTCEKCGEVHKNRKSNRCNKCKVPKGFKECETCTAPHTNKINKCLKCSVGFCKYCGKNIKNEFSSCYSCLMLTLEKAKIKRLEILQPIKNHEKNT